MPEFPPLTALGPRIILLGPTNAGKSTLAQAIEKKTGIPAVHLDQFRHLHGTDWQERPDDEFKALHDQAVMRDAWVMDGSYSKLMPARLARATGIIVLDDTLGVRVMRYFRRTLSPHTRAGALPGKKDSIKWAMLVWLWKTRNKAHLTRQFALNTGLPRVFVHNGRELEALYRAWGLER